MLLGSAELTIGMTRALVLARLGDSYDLKKVGKDIDAWLVVPKQAAGTPSALSSAIGSIEFKNDKLESISKDWGPEDQKKGADYGRSIYGALASLSSKGKTNCHIRIGQQSQQPDAETKAAFITCGDEYIEVDIVRNSEGEYSLVSEVLVGGAN